MAAQSTKANSPRISAPAIAKAVLLCPDDIEADTPMCRICFAGASSEQLLTPCDCRGSIRFVHRSCLERWLSTTAGGACELCCRQYDTVRVPKSCWEWIRHDEARVARRQMIFDLMWFLILTPLCLGGAWQCALKSGLVNGLLFFLCGLLFYPYLGFVFRVADRCLYHCAASRRWRARNFNVRVVDRQSPLGRERTDRPASGDPSATSSQPLTWQGGATPAHTGQVVSSISLLQSDRPSCS